MTLGRPGCQSVKDFGPDPTGLPWSCQPSGPGRAAGDRSGGSQNRDRRPEAPASISRVDGKRAVSAAWRWAARLRAAAAADVFTASGFEIEVKPRGEPP